MILIDYHNFLLPDFMGWGRFEIGRFGADVVTSDVESYIRGKVYVYGLYFILPLKLAHDLKAIMVAALGLYVVSIHTLSHHDFRRRVASPGPEVDFPQRSIEIERGAGNCRSVATSISL